MNCLISDKIEYQIMVNDFDNSGVPAISKILQLPQLSALKKDHGMKTVLKYMVLLLQDLQNSFNIKNKMNDEQLIELGNNLINDYWGFRLVDFSICFRNAKKNKYGNVYERLDMATVYNFVQLYDNSRNEEIQKNNNQYKNDLPVYDRTSDKNINDDPKFREILLKHIKQQKQKK